MLALILSLNLAACGGNKEKTGASSNADTSSEEPSGIQVEEGLLNVDITMPASFFEDKTEGEIKADADETGYGKCVINEDGSVTYTMSRNKHKEALAAFKNSIDEAIDGMVNGEDAVESFQKIEYNDNVSEVNIYVDQDNTAFDSFSGLAFYFMGSYYQTFSGNDPNSVDVVVNFIDNDTHETVETL